MLKIHQQRRRESVVPRQKQATTMIRLSSWAFCVFAACALATTATLSMKIIDDGALVGTASCSPFSTISSEPVSSREGHGAMARIASKELPMNQEAGNETIWELMMRKKCEPSADCNTCLYRSKRKGGPAELCAERCGCVADLLCNSDLTPLPIESELRVDVDWPASSQRLIPRIVHQTWREPLDRDTYPNWSRFQESFRLSGWDYRFYTDAEAHEFLEKHFPPEVVKAYDDLRPGAFKADLFRYCVLCIHGGIYADIDVHLNANLDVVLPSDLGFAVPLDGWPGEEIRNPTCLWNGLMASSPGHPFLAKAIELAVNGIRNRYTSFDSDARYCPIRAVYIGHKMAPLFVTGPCLLGLAVNLALGRHGQEALSVGELIPATSSFAAKHGRSVILEYCKEDLGAQRIVDPELNLIVATTDLADEAENGAMSDETTTAHYTKTRVGFKGTYGLEGVYVDNKRAHSEIRIVANE